MHRYPALQRLDWFSPRSKLTQVGRDIQRRFLVTDEELGRGRAFDWLEQQQHEKLQAVVDRKLRRLKRFERRGYRAYFEVSQFFIKTQADYVAKRAPQLGIIKLTRDPLAAARSLANRNKELFAGGPPPDWRQNVFRIDDWSRLSPFQIYLHRWLETELRHHRFVDRYEIKDVYHLATEELGSPARLAAMFRFFGIDHRSIDDMRPTNTNVASNNLETRPTESDVAEFEQMLNLMPAQLLDQIDYLRSYQPSLSRMASAASQ